MENERDGESNTRVGVLVIVTVLIGGGDDRGDGRTGREDGWCGNDGE